MKLILKEKQAKKFIIILCMMVSSCVTPQTNYPNIGRSDVELEAQRQREIVNAAKAQKGAGQSSLTVQNQLDRLRKVATKVQQGGIKLCGNIGRNPDSCIYTFGLSDQKEINAYADGKRIIVSQGMMNFANTDEDLAVVLGHEYAHNIMNHMGAQQQNVAIGQVLGTALDTLASSQGIGTGPTLGQIGGSVGSLRYSKEFEREADYVGLYITELAGYDISKAPEIWRRMSVGNEEAIYSGVTHPTNPERYLALSETIKEIERKKNNGAPLVPDVRVR
jgi:predicted Zn-dependent protease